MIYDLLLLVDPYRAYGSANYEWTPGPKGIYTAILQVNKQIHQKAKDVLYTSNCWMEVNFRCQAQVSCFFGFATCISNGETPFDKAFQPFLTVEIANGLLEDVDPDEPRGPRACIVMIYPALYIFPKATE